MRCSHCDQVLRAGATFCGRCGVPVRVAEPGGHDSVASAPVPARCPGAAGAGDHTDVRPAPGGRRDRRGAARRRRVPALGPGTVPAGAERVRGRRLVPPRRDPPRVRRPRCRVSLRGIGEKTRRGASSVAAAATALCVVSLDGGLDAAKVGAAVAVAGAVVLAASVPMPGRAPRVRSSASGVPQFEEVV